MKRVSTVLAAVAMMVGALGALGCKQQASAEAEAPVEQAAEAAADTGITEEATRVTASLQIPAPPALRLESPGRPPSARHVWQRGFWRWDRSTYVWVPGHWELRGANAPYGPPAARREAPGDAPSAAYFYVPGFWRWSGVEYVWVYGHWSLRRDAGSYYRPRWENRNGRWGCQMDRWDDNRMRAWEREHPRREAPRADHGPHAGAGSHAKAPKHDAPSPAPRPRMVNAGKPVLIKPAPASPKPAHPVAAPKPAKPRTLAGAKPPAAQARRNHG